jgi:hypothetical protein
LQQQRRLTVVVVVVEAEAEAEAEDTAAVAGSAQVPWVGSAEVMVVASAEVTLVALAEVTRLASAEVARRAWAETTMAMEDVVSAAITTTAAVTRHTTGPTPAPTEWRSDSEVADARLSKSEGAHLENWRTAER